MPQMPLRKRELLCYASPVPLLKIFGPAVAYYEMTLHQFSVPVFMMYGFRHMQELR